MENDLVSHPIDILLIEDNPADIELTREAFTSSKVVNTLNVVQDGVEAMKYLRKETPYDHVIRPDLILLDLNLPKKSGREILLEIKNDQNLLSIPVVILTSSDDEVDVIKSYAAGANCYVKKPVEFGQLEHIVSSIQDFWFTVVKLPPKVSLVSQSSNLNIQSHQVPDSAAHKKVSHAGSLPIKILHIEDSPADAHFVRELLSQQSDPEFQVTQEPTLTKALKLLNFVHFDCVILDLGLPDSQGLNTYSRLTEEFPLVPVVISSGIAEKDFAHLALKKGAQDYFEKSFEIDADLLVRSIRYAIERKRYSIALQNSYVIQKMQLEEIEDLYNNAPCGYQTLNKNGTIVRINDTALSWFGHKREDLVGLKKFEDLLTNQSKIKLRSIFENLRVNSGVEISEYQGIKRNGEIIVLLVNMSILYDRTGEVEAIRSTLYDITERNRVERVQKVYSDITSLLTKTLDIDEVSKTICRIVASEISSWCFLDLIQTEKPVRRYAASCFLPETEKILAGNRSLCTLGGDSLLDEVMNSRQLRHIRPVTDKVKASFSQGEHLPYFKNMEFRSFLLLPLLGKEGVMGALTFARTLSESDFSDGDIEVCKKIGESVAAVIDSCEVYQMLTDAIQSREEYVSVISHDLKTPLTSILLNVHNALKLISREATLDKIRNSIDQIQRSGQQMNNLLLNLLDLTKIDAGRLSLELRGQVPVDLLREVLDIFEPLAKEKSIILKEEVSIRNEISLFMDHDRILQVFLNLLGNAVKFTPENGTITLRAYASLNSIIFSISDTGPGIAPGDLPYVFDRYWQAEATKNKGTGLGLFIAKGIVEAHGGKIWAENNPTQGSTFSFSVPVSTDLSQHAA